MGLDADLRAALNTRILATTGFPALVELENTAATGSAEPFQASVTVPWARITHRFGSETLRTLPAPGGRLERTGFVQVDCFVPLLSGVDALDTLAQAIRDQCPPNLVLAVGGRRLQLQSSQRAGGARLGEHWWDHIDITWLLWATNPLVG